MGDNGFQQNRIDYIQCDSLQHSFTIQDSTITLTKTEYRLFYPLRHGSPLTYVELAQQAYNCDIDGHVRAMIDKHIDRIRSKMRGTGVYIYCILGYGYLLLDEESLEKNAS